MSNENKKVGRKLLLIIQCSKSKVLNDLAPVVFSESGDRKQLTILRIPDYFDPMTPADQWGKILSSIRNKYFVALALDERDKLDLRVL